MADGENVRADPIPLEPLARAYPFARVAFALNVPPDFVNGHNHVHRVTDCHEVIHSLATIDKYVNGEESKLSVAVVTVRGESEWTQMLIVTARSVLLMARAPLDRAQ